MNQQETRDRACNLHRNGLELEKAEKLYREVLLKSDDNDSAINLGALLRGQGRLKEAMNHYKVWISKLPQNKVLRQNGINCVVEAEAFKEGEEWANEGINQNNYDDGVKISLVKIYKATNRLPNAINLVEQMIMREDISVDILLEASTVYKQAGRIKMALDVLKRAEERSPRGDARALSNKLSILMDENKIDKCLKLIDKIDDSLKNNLLVLAITARLFMRSRRLEEAYKILEGLCLREPLNSCHWLNMAACLRASKHNIAAARVIKRGLSLNPNERNLEKALGQIIIEQGYIEKGLKLLEGKNWGESIETQDLYNYQFMGSAYNLINEEILRSTARSWENKVKDKSVSNIWADRVRDSITERKVKVGIISSDFADHPVGRFILPLFKYSDREIVDLIAISTGSIQDKVTEEIRHLSDKYIDISELNGIEGARVISDLKIDVLIETGGYTAGSRLDVLVHKPAPVQLSYLGYFAPTYLRSIDGWIGDRILFEGVSKKKKDKNFNLYYADGGYMAYENEELPDIGEIDMKRRFRFGCFNHTRKLTPETIGLFSEIMHRIPDADLLLKSISFIEKEECDRIRRQFKAYGVNDGRLVILPWVEGKNNHLKCYAHCDVGLDPIPYGGATTTCEALAMGVPVLTYKNGENMVNKLTESILVYSNQDFYVRENKEDLIQTLSKLASKGVRNKAERIELRRDILKSDLCNGKRLAEQITKIAITAFKSQKKGI